ncbi:hypothetical protein [Pseudomonas thivervalensis]|uniref:hypothetical protein n=1 Tax=Pseudomonas thivervalensis TaxID=86265 RepID=UPI00069F6549|nr:hypothetical protein [Pseudomonas thivervalensis]
MRIAVGVVTLLLSTNAAIAEEDFQVEVLARSVIYRMCVENYAKSHSGPGASPTEIAAAADFRCIKEFSEVGTYYRAHILKNFPVDESSAKKKELSERVQKYLLLQMDQALKDAQSAARSEASAIVIDQRNR